ncbi:hypothetical protein F0562_011212 [Nyssa sinensis]|uniref:Glycine-rich protein n=1 Tax=Nyssa sinensis TaxID=561372 RepID=A0A5J5A3C0_9ASTE|nr:hypothetical protein F0562_011212 [Nyssa sinensis]
MNPKASIFLALLFAVVLLISSAVAAETSKDEEKTKETNQVEEAQAMETEVSPEKMDEAPMETNQYGGGGRCRYGCCGGSGPYGCSRCCSSAAEAAEQEKNQVNNPNGYGGGYGGGGYGGGGYGGGGYGGRHRGGGRGRGRCCSNAEEARKKMENEGKH